VVPFSSNPNVETITLIFQVRNKSPLPVKPEVIARDILGKKIRVLVEYNQLAFRKDRSPYMPRRFFEINFSLAYPTARPCYEETNAIACPL
jgi:hypothetical protein